MKKCVKCGTQIPNDDYLCVSCLMNELSKKISGSSEIDSDESNPFRGTAFDSTDMLDAFGAPLFQESNAFNTTKSSLLSKHDVTDSDDINGNKYNSNQLNELFGVSKGNENQHISNNTPQDNDVSMQSVDDLFGEKNIANEKNNTDEYSVHRSTESIDPSTLFGSKDYSSLMDDAPAKSRMR